MRGGDADDLLMILRTATNASALDAERQAFWRERLLALDAEVATAAVLEGIEGWEFFPSWAKFHTEYRRVQQRRQSELEGVERRRRDAEIDRQNRGRELKMPLWLKRYYVARFVVKPPDMRRFPEMGEWADPDQPLMPPDEHVELANRITDAEAFSRMRKAMSSAELVGAE